VPRTLAICSVAGILLYLAGASPAAGQTPTVDHQSFASKGEHLTDAPIGNVTK